MNRSHFALMPLFAPEDPYQDSQQDQCGEPAQFHDIARQHHVSFGVGIIMKAVKDDPVHGIADLALRGFQQRQAQIL